MPKQIVKTFLGIRKYSTVLASAKEFGGIIHSLSCISTKLFSSKFLGSTTDENVTPLEPEWEGHVTLEFSNTTNLPAKIYANEGVAQMLFFESDQVCKTSYKDRGGKYQGQTGVTLPKT